MSTEFTTHPLSHVEDGDDQLGVLPTYDYTDWSFDLTVTRRSGTSPTLDVVIEEAPVDDDDEYETLVSFSQVDQNNSLPHEASKSSSGGDFTVPAGARFVRIDETIGGTDPEWFYLLTATVTLFDVNNLVHTNLLQDRYADHSDLPDKASQAEDDVVARYLKQPGDGTPQRPWPTTMATELTDTASEHLALRADESTGRRIREAIARRIEWLIRRDELENSTKAGDGPTLRRHLSMEWGSVDGILRHHDTAEPLYMI